MRRISTRTLVLTTSALAGATVLTARGAPAGATDLEENSHGTAVRALWAEVDRLWNERNAESFADLFTVDGDFVFVDRGSSLENRAAIHSHFAQGFPRLAPELRHATQVHDTRFIAPGVRSVDGRVEIRRTSPDSTEPTVIKAFAIFAVVQQAPDGWRIRMLRAYELPVSTGDGATP